MISFIIRRLVSTVFLLVVVSMITFGIFFLIPRLAGQNSYELAARFSPLPFLRLVGTASRVTPQNLPAALSPTTDRKSVV